MQFLDWLDKSVADGAVTMNEGTIRMIAKHPSSVVHTVLVSLADKGCVFDFDFERPADVEEAMEKLRECENISEKYVLALCILKFNAPLVGHLVDEILERIGV